MCPTVSGEGGISTNYWELAASIGPPFDPGIPDPPPPPLISDPGYSSSAIFRPGKKNMTKYTQCFGLFRLLRNSFFGCFEFYTETASCDVSIEPKQTKTSRNSLIESIFWYFQKILGCFGFFLFDSKQFCLFRLFRYRFETPKQTETQLKHNRNRPCFGLFRFE